MLGTQAKSPIPSGAGLSLFISSPTSGLRDATEMARRHAKSLESKGLLVRMKRTGQSNAFDLRPLSSALEKVLVENPRPVKAA
jgi:hypothetical protein